MKVAPIIRALLARQEKGGRLRYRLVHTGQHYDTRMSGTFFDQLGIPEPDVNLEVGSGSQAEQTGSIMVRYEKLLLENHKWPPLKNLKYYHLNLNFYYPHQSYNEEKDYHDLAID